MSLTFDERDQLYWEHIKQLPYVRINTAMAVNEIYSQTPWFPAEHDTHQCKKGWRCLCVHTVVCIGHKDCAGAVRVVRDRAARGLPSAFEPKEVVRAVATMREFGTFGRMPAQLRARLLDILESFMLCSSDGYRQMNLAAAMGSADIVGELLLAGVEPIACYEDNYALETAAQFGHVEVVKRLLQVPAVRARPDMYSVEACGRPPISAALSVIGQYQRGMPYDTAALDRYWAVVQVLAAAGGGDVCGWSHGDVVIKAPMPVLWAFARLQPAYMTSVAADMLATLVKTQGGFVYAATVFDWSERFALVMAFMPKDHPFMAVMAADAGANIVAGPMAGVVA